MCTNTICKHKLDANAQELSSQSDTSIIPKLSFSTGWMPFLLPSQQRQITEGKDRCQAAVK